MKRTLLVWLLFTAITSSLFAQKVELRFNGNKKFKIVQFTDLHIKWEDSRSNAAYDCIKNVVTAEKPDLIMITGDIIYSKPAAENFRKVMQFVAGFNIPFAIVFGNHDREQGVGNADLLPIAQSFSNCITTNEKGISGEGNCVLPIKSTEKGKNGAVLYCFDSHQSSQLKEKGVNGYDHIRLDQILWYVEESKELTKKNGGVPLPALAFFHIPTPEFLQAANDQNASLYGIRREKVCSPELNSGLFTAFKEQGDVMGVFVGHDHDNDFAVAWYNILLAYGRFSGGATEYNHIPNGARVIELTEGERSIHTWIRQNDGKVEQETLFPKDYTK